MVVNVIQRRKGKRFRTTREFMAPFARRTCGDTVYVKFPRVWKYREPESDKREGEGAREREEKEKRPSL